MLNKFHLEAFLSYFLSSMDLKIAASSNLAVVETEMSFHVLQQQLSYGTNER
jgi:hypothetical protein